MAKDDKELGKWQGTSIINSKVYIKRFDYGFTIKSRGESITEKIKFDRKTTVKDMCNISSRYL